MVLSDLAIATLPPPPRTVPWGIIASIAFHGMLALALLVLSPLRDLGMTAPPVVTVDLVSPTEFEALQEPAALATPRLAPGSEGMPSAPRLEPEAPPEPETKTVTATQFYSANILRQPAEAQTRQFLTQVADSERIVQICNIEALEQIRRAAPDYDPDTVVGYAMADLAFNGLALTAAGGAFRSRRRWYEIAYHCTAAPGYEGVTAFDFTLGAEIPESEWEGHYLNAEDSDD